MSDMARVQMAVRGMRAEKGPAARKLPRLEEDLRDLDRILNTNSGDRRIVWCADLAGWFFILRMSES